jgi:phosphoglucomutase
MMTALRQALPDGIAGESVVRIRDYLDGSIYVAGLGKVDHTPMSGSNVLYFEMADGSTFIIRPSGTEPKIKIYILVRGADEESCAKKIQRFSDFAEKMGK